MITKTVRILGIGAALVLGACQTTSQPPPPAQTAGLEGDHTEVEALQRADFRRLTCAQALADKELVDAVMIWVDGYAHGRSRRPVTSRQELVEAKTRFQAACERNPNMTVDRVVREITGPQARRLATMRPTPEPPAPSPAASPAGGAAPAAPGAPAPRALTPARPSR